MVRTLFIVLSLVLTLAPRGADAFTFDVDAAVFRGSDGPEVEVSILIPVRELSFERSDSLFTAAYAPDLRILDRGGKEVRRLRGSRTASLATEQETTDPTGTIDDIARFNLAPGDYRAELTVRSGRAKHTRRFDLRVPEFATGQLALSGVVLARAVDPEDAVTDPDRFRKAGRVVLPAPAGRFDSGAPIRFYVELYEIGQLPHGVRFSLIDPNGHHVVDHERGFGGYRDEATFLEGFPVRHLPAGSYTLRVTATAGAQTATVEKAISLAGTPSKVSPMFDVSRQDHVRTLIAAEDPEAAEAYDGLDTRGRALFAYGFWLERDPLLAGTYVGTVTGLSRHVLRMPMLKALKNEGTLKKRVDRTFAERLEEPDTLAVRKARERLDAVLDEAKDDPAALTGDALLALHAGLLAEGEIYGKKALEGMPGLSDAQNAVGLSKVGRRDWNGAIKWFEAAAASDDGWPSPRFNAEIARFLSGKGDKEEELAHVKRAAIQDLGHPDVYYVAGRILERHEKLDESVAAYRRQIAVNPMHGRARFDLGRVLYKQAHLDSAAAVWRELMTSQPSYRSICVSPLLDAYIRDGETGKAQALIADELRALDPESRARVEDISLVASPDEMKTYESLPEEARSAFVRAFWQKRDPTPATPGNERLVEHYRRVVHALHNYPSEKRGWDRRGDVYIRYGEPAHISRHDDVRYETDPKVIRVRERLMRSLSSEAREEIIARAGRYRTSTRDRTIHGEYGQRVEYHDFESIDFEMNPNRGYFISDQDTAPEYVRGTEEATYRGRMREKPIHGIPLFPVDGGTTWEYWIYPDVAGGIEVVFTSLTPTGELDYPDLPRGRELARFNEKVWEERRSEQVIARARREQPDRYVPPGDAFDFHFTSADFRGADGRSRLEVYYGVPVQELMTAADDGSVFERGIALFDSTWTPIFRNTEPMAFSASEDEVEQGTLAIDEIALQLPPGPYYLGVQVNHPASKRWAGYTQELIVEDYAADTLALSDIEIAGEVEADSTTTVKGGLRVLPMPSLTFKPGQPVLVYYEVYGLARDEFGQTRYRVDYRIKPRKGKLSAVRVIRALGRLLGFEEKAIVTISYERTGTDRDEQNYIEIDPGESKEGVYELTVTVTDLTASTTIEKSTQFLIGG